MAPELRTSWEFLVNDILSYLPIHCTPFLLYVYLYRYKIERAL